MESLPNSRMYQWGLPISVGLLLADLTVDIVRLVQEGFAACEAVRCVIGMIEIVTVFGLMAYFTRRLRQIWRRDSARAALQSRLAGLAGAALRGCDSAALSRDVAALLVDGLQPDVVLLACLKHDANDDSMRLTPHTVLGRATGKTRPADWTLHVSPSSLAAHVLANDAQPFCASDITRDSRFAVPPLPVAPLTGCLGHAMRVEDKVCGAIILFYGQPLTTLPHPEQNLLSSCTILLAGVLQQNKAARALWESEQLFRQLAEAIPEVFYVTDPECTRVEYISPAYEVVWGRRREELYQSPRSWLDAIYEEDRPMAELAIHKMAQQGTYDRTYRIIDGHGKLRWVRDRAFPIFDEDGALYRVAGLAADITVVMNAEEAAARLRFTEERQARMEAEAGMRARDQVLAVVSHDLRTPLSSITMAVDRLSQGALSDTKVTSYARRIKRAAARMDRLVQDLLDISRVESGTLRLDRTQLSVSALWQELSETYPESVVGGVGVTFGDVPDDILGLHVDRGRLLQALGNLVDNAIKFTPEGGTVHISVRGDGRHIIFAVEDTGIGISAENVHQIFEPFWQSQSSDRRGLGLGLNIAKGIIEAHGGQIWAARRASGGTIMRCALPASRPPLASPVDDDSPHTAARLPRLHA